MYIYNILIIMIILVSCVIVIAIISSIAISNSYCINYIWPPSSAIPAAGARRRGAPAPRSTALFQTCLISADRDISCCCAFEFKVPSI